ncbi:hypothetical protein Hypma_014419 [Hypsizygus marmoreus]|uniref:Uncharacterized protein n=1 Tax=Hypsizygus marmoreus TaxID=39966 RepID=A0A369JHV5_HYPMA|nr:hypothetical protein Hypma_014419 [Hypsizygus marmoreus]
MPRPQLYHTPEEKKAANRAKSNRHYARKKGTIRARRSVQYREQSKRNEFRLGNNASSSEAAKASEEPSPRCVLKLTSKISVTYITVRALNSGLLYWCDRVERVVIRLNKLVDGDAYTYIDTVCKQYLLSCRKDEIRDTILHFTPLQKSINWYHDEILQLAGMGKETARVEDVSRMVRDVVNALEDLLCTSMLGYNDLSTSYSKQGLMYQNLFK